MDNPLVSIIMPSYNSGIFINKAIDSVLKQTYTNWELIIVDNCSTDNTVDIIKKYNNSKIKLFKLQNEGVVGKSRNFGINFAKGDFLAFLDSDDCWHETKLEKSIKTLCKGYDFVHHDLYILKESETEIKKKFNFRDLHIPIFYSLLFNGNAIINSTVVVKTELVRKLNGFDNQVGLIASEDYDLWLRISKLTNKFYKIPETLGFYWYGSQNLSKNKNFSIAYKIISNKHNDILSKRNKVKINGYFNYLNGCYYYFENKPIYAFAPFLISLFFSTWYIRSKSLYRLFRVIIKILFNLIKFQIK